ncbi:MAG TPA: protein kinase [Polyangia bacterium]|nr:protein kinase [Polyangia bacterium]
MTHPASESLELYAIGAHDQISVPEIEAHLRVCEGCTTELRRQVQVDLALAEVAAGAVFCPGCGAVMTAASCSHCGAVAEAGGFRVERVLVQNAHGRMYLARDGEGNQVALKELAFVQAPHPDAIDAFEREARLLRQLSHPQIPRFLGAFREGEGVHTRLYLAQEYVDGQSLHERLQSHQFSEQEARDVAEQVLSILEYLQGLAPMVFHRDIKPANLIRRADGRIALVDFGAARDLGATVGATLVGTFGYMPVEQMGGIVDASTDLYALGATLCHLLSRRPPWKFIEDPRALERLDVSRGLRDWLAKLTARQPEDRYRSAAAAARGLASPPRRPRAWAPAASGRGIVFMALLGLTVLGVGVVPFMALLRAPDNRQVRRDREIIRLGPAEPVSRPSDEPVAPWADEPADHGASSGGKILWLNICTSATGEVTSVAFLNGGKPNEKYGRLVLEQAKRFKYDPQTVNGRAVPSCRSVKYVIPDR